jgi:hypothetical protein
MKHQVRFPWDRVEVGQSLFVPCLDLKGVRERGLLSALPFRYRITTVYAIKDGKLGVLFTRTR